ncbi:MAG: hypothetical protein ABI397_02865 [Candidatus Saccharimonas sp.]
MLPVVITMYITAQTAAISCSWPQLKRLIEVKNSDGFSLTTWSVWTISQVVTGVYALANQQLIWCVMCLAWIAFYATMVSLIVKYRRPSIEINLPIVAPGRELELQEATPDDYVR